MQAVLKVYKSNQKQPEIKNKGPTKEDKQKEM